MGETVRSQGGAFFMKKAAAVAMAAIMMFSAPVSGFAASNTVTTHKRIYSSAKYQSGNLSYSTTAVKLSKKSGGKDYIKTDVNYINVRGYSSTISNYNAKSKETARKLAQDFIDQYAKESKKYFDANNGSKRSDKAEPFYSLKVETSVKFNRNSVISVFYTVTETVAESKSISYYSENFDFVTGKELTPDDVSLILPEGETMKLAVNEFNSKIRNNPKIYYQDVKITQEDINFYFEDKAIVFFLNPGVAADPSRGIVTYKLIDDAARTYLKKKVS